MKQQEKVLFYEKSDDLKKIDDGLEYTKVRVERILEEWRKITDNAPLTMTMVTDFMTRNFLGVRLVDEGKIFRYVMTERVRNSPLFNEIDTDSLIKMTTKKPDFSGLVEAVQDLCSGVVPGPLFDPRDQYRPECFRINGDRVELVTDQVEQVRSFYISYAVNTEEKHRLKLVQAIIGAYDALRSEYDIELHKVAISGLVVYDAINERLLPSPTFVKDGKAVSGNYATRSGMNFDNSSPTIGDIRSQVPHHATNEDGELDAIRKIADKRNAQYTT